ncbi:HsdM family class I SAM-dependent methyltransferase [Rhodanobacter lindaniclasticus]|uniref:site-specific DNA-methyltransferase (adenine-specific) n=1 Tax=Rhodanobacter lindaniclasticus TaxID=75310 RepID=A0A4S3KIM1_9GAMM|nr:class I SAM-dependent DNA methyltransferase [Rhodanobacter lindaniclasticus]THD08597.1 SAM-dependent methyltransferase [Rhodanobacter lindaniclasticus]
MNPSYQQQTRDLIDGLKAVCASAGLGNDGNEYKIIVQTFLYKLLCDKFAYEMKRACPALAGVDDWIVGWQALPEEAQQDLQDMLPAETPRLTADQLIPSLFNRQSEPGFAKLWDDTLIAIAVANNDIFAVQTDDGEKVALFDRLSEYVTGSADKRDGFVRALFNKLVGVSFERLFEQKYDFYAALFEYLIKDYNKDNGGKYAEYYTPHAVATIMADILVPQAERGTVKNVTCYDPASGSGTLLMALAHALGEDHCSIFSQDISQKSSSLLRLNLVLNKLVHSIPHITQGNTILHPVHKEGKALRRFDYIVSNPPFKMDFSDFRDDLESDANTSRFFAGIPKVPAKAKDKMAIYLLFIQHIIASLKPGGKAAVVVPTGFITAASGIELRIRQKLVDEKMIAGVVSMPSNIFATTGTNVSILFLDRPALDTTNRDGVVLIDASALGEKVKEGKNQKTLLSHAEEQRIVATFNAREAVEDFSVVVDHAAIAAKNYSLSAGQYFEVKIEYSDLSPSEFSKRIAGFNASLGELFQQSKALEKDIEENMSKLTYEAQ